MWAAILRDGRLCGPCGHLDWHGDEVYSVVMTDFNSSIEAEFVSTGYWESEEIILLTGGMIALAVPEDSVVFFPVLNAGKITHTPPVPQREFIEWITSRRIDFVGIKQVTYEKNTSHWRWAPATKCVNPPSNNPFYKWQSLSSSIHREIKNGKSYQVLGQDGVTPLTDEEMIELATQARYVALALHQLNFAIVNIAEYFHRELISHLSTDQPLPVVYAHIRSFDLSAFVHSFFQAYSSARDHYATFLSISIRVRKFKRKKQAVEIDTMPKLLEGVDASILRKVPLIEELEHKGLISASQKGGVEKFDICSDTWLWYSNYLRNRFTHRYPYGAGTGEENSEIYFSECDSSIQLAKSFLESDSGATPPNLLRTINHLYQSICGLFILAAESTGYITDPLKISLD